MDAITLSQKQDMADASTLIAAFFCQPLNRKELGKYSEEELKIAGEFLIKIIDQTHADDIFHIIMENETAAQYCAAKNIPQFSSYKDIDTILPIVQANPGQGFDCYGYFFNKNGSMGARMKYGENHYKAASILGLVTREKPFELTHVGLAYLTCKKDTREQLRAKLCMRVPIVQILLQKAWENRVCAYTEIRKYLSESTTIRRKSNVKEMVKHACDELSEGLLIFSNIDWGKPHDS